MNGIRTHLLSKTYVDFTWLLLKKAYKNSVATIINETTFLFVCKKELGKDRRATESIITLLQEINES